VKSSKPSVSNICFKSGRGNKFKKDFLLPFKKEKKEKERKKKKKEKKERKKRKKNVLGVRPMDVNIFSTSSCGTSCPISLNIKVVL